MLAGGILARSADSQELTIIPPLAYIDKLTTDPDISSGQIRLPEPRHGGVHTMPFPSTIQEDGETSHAYPPPPRDSDEVPTINLIQSISQDPTPKRVFDPPEVIQVRREQETFAAENVPQVAVPERDEVLRHQMAELASLIRQMLALYGEKKALMDQQWTEEQATARQSEEQHQMQANEDNLRIEQVIDEIRKMDVEHRELLQGFSDMWRVDSERLHEEIISAVHAIASEQVPFNVEGYLDEFSKTLSTEVRILLGEIGKLREERQRIQYELGYLLTMQSTLGPNGGTTDWPPEYVLPRVWPSPAGIPLPETPLPRPAWRSVPLRRNPPRPEPSAPDIQVPSWVTWQRAFVSQAIF
ncbi:hypothetical protein OG21DRAFT_783265 [Imleria badia]|nr:hypothetical protein OG21DRAFT_783265 [Imleria badia]